MKKKLLALLLCSAMLVSALTGCGSSEKGGKQESDVKQSTEEKNYDEKYDLTFSIVGAQAGVDYTADAYYDYICEKFNVNIEFLTNDWTGFDERETTMINTLSMPEMLNRTGFSMLEYYEYVDQGLVKALPDNWEERWPNIAAAQTKTPYSELLDIDGADYAILHPVFGSFASVEWHPGSPTFYFRADWAEQVGMADFGDDYSVTISEIREYIEKVADAGLCDNPKLGITSGYLHSVLKPAFGISTSNYWNRDGEYVYTPATTEYMDFVKTVDEWYHEDILDPDFYVKAAEDYMLEFATGLMPAYAIGGDAGNMANFYKQFAENNPDIDTAKAFGVACVTADDGSVGYMQNSNYWTGIYFNPDLDDAKQERILDMIDYMFSKEGQISSFLGIPEVDWKYDENGGFVRINEGDYTSQEVLYLLGWCQDDFSHSGASPSVPAEVVEKANSVFARKQEGTNLGTDIKYDMYQSDTKDTYSMDPESAVVEAVMSESDAETAWADYLKKNEAMWKTLLDEVNEEIAD